MNYFFLQHEFPEALFLSDFFTKTPFFFRLHLQMVPESVQNPTDILKAKFSFLDTIGNKMNARSFACFTTTNNILCDWSAKAAWSIPMRNMLVTAKMRC